MSSSKSLAELGWRTFNFFNLVPVNDPADPNKKATILQGIDILCWTPGNEFVLFGEPRGAIFQLDRNLEIRFFKAFKQRLIHFAHAQNLLVAIGDDSETQSDISAGPSSSIASKTSLPSFAHGIPVMKCWDLNQWNDALTPKCLFTFSLNLGKKIDVSKACAIGLSPNAYTLVIGLSDTSLFYAHGDLQRERGTPKFRLLRDKLKMLEHGQLVGISVGHVNERTIISCISERALNSYILAPDGNLSQTIIHDAKGCERSCWFFSPVTNQLIVAGREMIYFYNLFDFLDPEMGGENGRCHALGRGGDKVQLIEANGLVALLTEQEANIQSSSNQNSRMTMLNIYDIDQRFIAFFCSMPSPCHLFLLDGNIYLLNAEGVLNRLVEETLNNKLDILLRKNLYDLAISIARRSYDPDEELCNSIYMRYGDYLYKKGDYDNAMKQYVKTIGHVQPSNIIKKFLEGSKVNQLCQYLEALHQQQHAETIGQHTTLLLSAYVKLDATRKLSEFINQGERFFIQAGFDAEAAIKLIRSAQLYRIAANLALKCMKPDMFLDILCRDTQEWSSALSFIAKLPTAKACDFLELYGPLLLEHEEEATLGVIKQVILTKEANLKQLIKILISRPKRLEELFSELNMAGELCDPQLRNTLLEQRLQRLNEQELPLSAEQLNELLELIGPDNFEQALLLEQRHKCPPLVVHILRTQNRKEELFRYLLREGSVVDAMEVCGEKAMRDMWIDLIHFVSARPPSESKKADLLALLKRISESDLLQPLIVLELLSRDDSLQVGDIRDYVVGWLEKQNAAIRKVESQLSEKEKKLEQMNKEIDDLENNDQVFQVTKCAVCNNPLQVPAVHFLCRHSYHSNCFESYSGSNPDQCPACAVTIRQKEKDELQQHQQRTENENANQYGKINQRTTSSANRPFTSYQQFKNELANSTDVMALITDYIVSGAFNNVQNSNSTAPNSSTKSSIIPKHSTNPFDDNDDE